jgi:hypothetical protein
MLWNITQGPGLGTDSLEESTQWKLSEKFQNSTARSPHVGSLPKAARLVAYRLDQRFQKVSKHYLPFLKPVSYTSSRVLKPSFHCHI